MCDERSSSIIGGERKRERDRERDRKCELRREARLVLKRQLEMKLKTEMCQRMSRYNKASIPNAKTSSIIHGILNRKNKYIRGGNSGTHRDCVSCVDGPMTLPNSKFSNTQLSYSNVRIRCKACVNSQRHKNNVTDHHQQLSSTHQRDCNDCGLFLPLKTHFSGKELTKGKNKMKCKSCCILLQEREKNAKDVQRNKAENRAANVHSTKKLQLSSAMMTKNKTNSTHVSTYDHDCVRYEKEMFKLMTATVRVCTMCGFSKPKKDFHQQELLVPQNRWTIKCKLCAQRETDYLQSLRGCDDPSQQHLLQQQHQQQQLQLQKQHFQQQQQQQQHGQSQYPYQMNQQHTYNDNHIKNTNVNGNGGGAIQSPPYHHRPACRNYGIHDHQQQQQQQQLQQHMPVNHKTKNKINKYAYGHVRRTPSHRPSSNDDYALAHVPSQQHTHLPPTTHLSPIRSINTQPNSKQQLSPTSTSVTPTKSSGNSTSKSKMLSPTSTSFIPASGLTIDELLKGMTSVRIEQQPRDEDITYVVDEDDDDESIQTATTTMMMMYPPHIQNTTLLVGCDIVNTNKNNNDGDDLTTTTTATSTTASSSTITPNVDEQDSTHNLGGGGGRKEGIESFLLGSLLDLENPNEEQKK